MKILYLGPYNNKIIDFLKNYDMEIKYTEEKIENDSDFLDNVDYIISYRYRFIIKENVINMFQNRIINLHISYLPWNRGADPNLWSFIEDTPRGVSIHYIDKGIDTGDIIAQKKVSYYKDDTLKTMYYRLCEEIESLFIEIWPDILSNNIRPFSQSGVGSYHKLSDKKKLEHLLVDGWDTPVQYLLNKQRWVNNE